MARDSECKLWLREEDEERKRGTQTHVHNEQDEQKGEQREMRGIEKCSRSGRSVVCLCVCVRACVCVYPRGDGE